MLQQVLGLLRSQKSKYKEFSFKTAGAVVTGISHIYSGTECQDSLCIEESNGICSISLSDGAGSRRFSRIGAEIATRSACKLLVSAFDELYELDADDAKERIYNAVIEAFTASGMALDNLLCTLIFFAMCADGKYVLGHIGDGAAVMVSGERSFVISYPENGQYENETFFLGEDSSLTHFRLHKGEINKSGGIMLFCDGTAEGLYQKSTGEPAPSCERIYSWLKEGDPKEVSEGIEQNLRDVISKKSSDDLSLVMMVWK